MQARGSLGSLHGGSGRRQHGKAARLAFGAHSKASKPNGCTTRTVQRCQFLTLCEALHSSKSPLPQAVHGEATMNGRRAILLATLAGFSQAFVSVAQAADSPSAQQQASGAPLPSGSSFSPTSSSQTSSSSLGSSSNGGASSSSTLPSAGSTGNASASGTNGNSVAAPLVDPSLSDEAARRYLAEEDERRRRRKTSAGRIRELEEIRMELAEKELALIAKEKELLEKEQTVAVLKEELDLERKLRALLTREKERAEEEAALAMGLCTGGLMFP